MNKVLCWIFAPVLFWGISCARQEPSEGGRVALTLQLAGQTASKVDLLDTGDAAGVFVRTDGVGSYTFENYRFVSDASGTLQGDPMVYFPDAQQATQLLVYLPYVAGPTDPSAVAFTTPVDQTSDSQARQADLLWGRTASTPTAVAVPVPLEHLLSQVIVSTSQSIDRWSVHNVLVNGALDVESGAFTPGTTRAHVAATGRDKLILIPQSIQTLDFTVDGVDYTFEASAPIALAAGQRYTLDLTLHPANHTATLTEPVQVEEWVLEPSSGMVEHVVRNTITAHWLLPHPDFAAGIKAVLHVEDGITGQKVALSSTDYRFDPSSSNKVGQCTFAIGSTEGVHYPFKIEKIDFLRADGSLVQSCGTLVGQGIYRSGAVSFGIYQDNILLVTTDPITEWSEQTVVGEVDNIKYQGNSFVVKVIEPDFAYQKVAKVRLSIWGGVSEWDIAVPTVSSGFANFVVETSPFSFPDSKGYSPDTRHYPIEWVELVDSGGGYLYRGYCRLEVSAGGDITLLLYQKGAVHSPSTIVRPIEEGVSGALDNVNFVGNTFRVRFVGPDFIDASRPKVHTIRMGVLGDVFSWSGVSLHPASNFFTAWVDVDFPDQSGYRPASQYYQILWVEVLDASGGYLYKSYCTVDVTHSGSVTLDLHQRGVVGTSGSTVGRPEEESGGESNPLGSTKYVANAFDIRFFEPPFAYWTTTAVALTCSDGKTYTWNTGIWWNGSSRIFAQATPSWPDRSGFRPLGYPFQVTKIEAFRGAASIYKKEGLSVEVSAYGTVLISLYK